MAIVRKGVNDLITVLQGEDRGEVLVVSPEEEPAIDMDLAIRRAATKIPRRTVTVGQLNCILWHVVSVASVSVKGIHVERDVGHHPVKTIVRKWVMEVCRGNMRNLWVLE